MIFYRFVEFIWLINILFIKFSNMKQIDDFVPPNIYRWIAQNRRICSYDSKNGFFGFLDEKRGLECNLCPRTSPRGIPRMACAEIIFGNSVLKTVCYEIPTMCVIKLKWKYEKFYMRVPNVHKQKAKGSKNLERKKGSRKNLILHSILNEKLCVDKNELCCFRAMSGECNKYHSYMKEYCPNACGYCGCDKNPKCSYAKEKCMMIQNLSLLYDPEKSVAFSSVKEFRGKSLSSYIATSRVPQMITVATNKIHISTTMPVMIKDIKNLTTNLESDQIDDSFVTMTIIDTDISNFTQTTRASKPDNPKNMSTTTSAPTFSIASNSTPGGYIKIYKISSTISTKGQAQKIASNFTDASKSSQTSASVSGVSSLITQATFLASTLTTSTLQTYEQPNITSSTSTKSPINTKTTISATNKFANKKEKSEKFSSWFKTKEYSPLSPFYVTNKERVVNKIRAALRPKFLKNVVERLEEKELDNKVFEATIEMPEPIFVQKRINKVFQANVKSESMTKTNKTTISEAIPNRPYVIMGQMKRLNKAMAVEPIWKGTHFKPGRMYEKYGVKQEKHPIKTIEKPDFFKEHIPFQNATNQQATTLFIETTTNSNLQEDYKKRQEITTPKYFEENLKVPEAERIVMQDFHVPHLNIKELAITKTSSTTEKVVDNRQCYNYHPYCKFWADRKQCEENPSWMKLNCQKSCNSCGGVVNEFFTNKRRLHPGKNCVNYHTLCEFWKSMGECKKNPIWMNKSCRLSCICMKKFENI